MLGEVHPVPGRTNEGADKHRHFLKSAIRLQARSRASISVETRIATAESCPQDRSLLHSTVRRADGRERTPPRPHASLLPMAARAAGV